MNVINVYKQANGFVYELDFAAGATSWSFTSQHTGKLVKAVMTNVASYQIGGASVSFPFQITNGNSYAVTIIPTDAAQPATIKFYADDSDYLLSSANVPNFSSYNGRYLYILNTSGTTIYKIDTALLAPSNYSGAGVWVVNPIVNTITLPVLPNGATYTYLTFVKQGGVNRMFVLGGTYSGNFNLYGCFIRCSDDTIWNFSQTVQNTYSLLYTSILYTAGIGIIYDFVNEIVYVKANTGSNGTNVFSLNLTTSVVSNLGYGGFEDTLFPISTIRPFQFIPSLQRWSYANDFSFIYKRFYNGKIAQNAGSFCSYQNSLGTTNRNSGNIATQGLFNSFGERISTIAATGSGTNLYSSAETITLDALGLIFTSYSSASKTFSIIKYTSPVGGKYADAGFLESTASGLKSLMGSNYSGDYYALSSGTTSKRLLIFNYSQTPVQFAYLEFAENLNQMHTNQLII